MGREPTTLHEGLQRWASDTPHGPALGFLDARGRVERSLTYPELEVRARAVAATLQGRDLRGERALLVFASGLEFVEAFLACALAGVTAVPCPTPRPRRSLDALCGFAGDCDAAAVLSTIDLRDSCADRLTPPIDALPWMAVDEVADSAAAAFRDPGIEPRGLAYLQYTSGSTSRPKGVMVSHANVAHNVELMCRSLGLTRDTVVSLGWLPLYHDMGLAHLLVTLLLGGRGYVMSPMAVVQRPVRWLQAISRIGATLSGAPAFAYEDCVKRVTDGDRAGLGLATWRWAVIGAEPIRPRSVRRFVGAFVPGGLDPRAIQPAYGLAESTVYVTGGPADVEPAVRHVDAEALRAGRVDPVEPTDAGAAALVASGPADGGRIRIVDPETRLARQSGRIGEIWVRGPSVARGYWGRPELSRRVFRARLADRDEAEYLRTGDLGFVDDGLLFVTGRADDLLIVRGRNHYPHDIERCVEERLPSLRPGRSAAFLVDGAREPELVVVGEVKRRQRRVLDRRGAVAAMRAAVTERHELRLHHAVLTPPGSVPTTTSGKVRRSACRAAFLDETLPTL